MFAAFVLWAAAFGLAATRGLQADQATPPFIGILDEHPVIQYKTKPVRDRLAHLNQSIARGEKTLAFQPAGGYLRSVLDALGVPVDSQLLVVSKTGVQSALTDPRSPRAIFFDQSVVVGYVPGARYLELAAHDPEQGVQFYVLDQSPDQKPILERRTTCLACHVSASTLEVPGLIARSNFVDDDGNILPQLGQFVVDHRTPLMERWGGWFVTGEYTPQPYGTVVHMGNLTTSAQSAGIPGTLSNEAFIRWLDSSPESRGYASTDSDIASLMAFDHQAHAINLLTRLNWEARVAAATGRAGYSKGTLREFVDQTADYLLFVGEQPPPAPITPRARFIERFAAGAPRDRRGRSLRDLDLDTRLLRYPCSYMIYSDAFEGLPSAARRAVLERMWTILSGRDPRPESRMAANDRRAIVEILRDTLKDLPAGYSSDTR